MSSGISLAGEECFLDGSTKFVPECLFPALAFPNDFSTPPSLVPFVGKFDGASKADRLLGRVVLKLILFSVNSSSLKCSYDFCLVICSCGVFCSCKPRAPGKSENDFDLVLVTTKCGSTVVCLPTSGEFGGVKNLGLGVSLSSLDNLIAGSLVCMRRTNRACSALRLERFVLYSLSRISYVDFNVADLPRFAARALLDVSVKSD